MFWIKILKKLLKALNADASPSEIAAGVVLGSIIGLTPAAALHNILIIILIIVIRVNVSSAIFSSALFAVIGFALDPLSDTVGTRLLTNPALENLWTQLYNTPVIPLARFNNTVVLGSLVISLILAVPLFFVTVGFVKYYRNNLQERVQKLKIVRFLKASKIYNIYTRFKG